MKTKGVVDRRKEMCSVAEQRVKMGSSRELKDYKKGGKVSSEAEDGRGSSSTGQKSWRRAGW